MRRPHILLNPGHDIQLDAGAVNGSITEARVVEKLGYSCIKAFDKYDSIYPVFVTMKQSDSLEAVVDYSNEMKCDLFLSLHMNHINESFGDYYTGTSAFYYPSSIVSKYLAVSLSKCISGVMPTPWQNLGAFPNDDIMVLRLVAMPSVLLKVGFMSSARDLAFVRKLSDDIGDAIALCVLHWWYSDSSCYALRY